MFYYLYEIKNLINDKIYVGVHKTKSMDDSYMGSGKIILSAINKHGIENFTKTILETFESSEAMFAREKEVVTDEFLARSDVYNLRRGGFGGFDYINKTGTKHIQPFTDGDRAKGRKTIMEMSKEEWNKINVARHTKFGKEKSIEWSLAGRVAMLSESAKEKRQKTFLEIGHQQGATNSQHGTMWITDKNQNKKIKNTSPIPAGWQRGRVR